MNNVIHKAHGFFDCGDWLNFCTDKMEGECAGKWENVTCKQCLDKQAQEKWEWDSQGLRRTKRKGTK